MLKPTTRGLIHAFTVMHERGERLHVVRLWQAELLRSMRKTHSREYLVDLLLVTAVEQINGADV